MKPSELIAAFKKIDFDGLAREIMDTTLGQEESSESKAVEVFNSDWIHECFDHSVRAAVSAHVQTGASIFSADHNVVKSIFITAFLAGIAFKERLSGIEELEKMAK